MEILQQIVGFSQNDMPLEQLSVRFQATPVPQVAGIRSFLFSIAKEKGLVEASRVLIEREDKVDIKNTLIQDICGLTSSIKKLEPISKSMLRTAFNNEKSEDHCVDRAKLAEIELLFGFNDCRKNEEIPPPEKTGQYVAYRLKQQGSCIKTKPKPKPKRKSRARELRKWTDKMSKEFAEIDKHELSVQYCKVK